MTRNDRKVLEGLEELIKHRPSVILNCSDWQRDDMVAALRRLLAEYDRMKKKKARTP